MGKWVKGHGHTMYTAKMCLNSVLGDCIHFICGC